MNPFPNRVKRRNESQRTYQNYCASTIAFIHEANENTFPFPSGTIGKTYERDEVEVVWQYHINNKWANCDNGTTDDFQKGLPKRQIFRLSPQPVEKEPETVDNELYFEVAGIAQENIIFQNPDKFKHPRLKQPWNEKAKKKYHDQVQLDVLQFIRDLKEKGYVITKKEASR